MAAVADEDFAAGDDRGRRPWRRQVAAPELAAAGAVERVEVVVGAADEDAVAVDRGTGADLPPGLETPAPRAGGGVDGVDESSPEPT